MGCSLSALRRSKSSGVKFTHRTHVRGSGFRGRSRPRLSKPALRPYRSRSCSRPRQRARRASKAACRTRRTRRRRRRSSRGGRCARRVVAAPIGCDCMGVGARSTPSSTRACLLRRQVRRSNARHRQPRPCACTLLSAPAHGLSGSRRAAKRWPQSRAPAAVPADAAARDRWPWASRASWTGSVGGGRRSHPARACA